MKTRYLVAILVIWLAVSMRVKIADSAPRAEHVFIVSFDGGKPAVMQKSQMPTLFDMVHTGATTWKAQTVFPSITLVSHTSMLTGVLPEVHKISWNEWEPERGLVQVPTVFKLARDSGYTTAIFAGKEKFRHLNIPGTIDEFQVPSYQAKLVAEAAAKYIEEKRPSLCFVHFADTDGAGHLKGWGSPEQIKAFGDCDQALKTLRDAVEKAGITDSSVFILTADHGGHDRTHGSNSPEDMTIPWITWGIGVKNNFEITAPVSTCDTAATALWLLGVKVPSDWKGKPVTSAYNE